MRWGRIGGGVALLTVVVVLAACGGGTGGKGTSSGVPFDLVTTDTNGVVASVAGTSTHASTHASSTSAKPSATAASSTHGSSHVAVTTSHAAPYTSAAHNPACANNPDAYTGSQHITVTPNTCMASPTTVRITASGFKNGEALEVIECTDNSQGPADCMAPSTVYADANGNVSTTLQVIRGPFPTQTGHIPGIAFPIQFGGHHPTCSPTTLCVVSVSEPRQPPPREADRRITFTS